MALTCTCTCNYCRTIREDDSGAQQNSWLSRNRSLWTLIEIPLFILIVLCITILGLLPVILIGGVDGYLLNRRVILGMLMHTISWVWFAWSCSMTYLINWCHTCSNKCRIKAAMELATQLSTSIFNPPSSQANLPENYDVEAQPPVPELPAPLRDDEPCIICSLENLQGNQRIWNARTFERCGHRYHSRCLMHELIQQHTCPPCLYNANLPRNHDLEAPPPRQ